MEFTGLWGASVRDLYKFYFIIFFVLLGQVYVRCRVYCKDDACVCSAGCARGCVNGGDCVSVCGADVFVTSFIGRRFPCLITFCNFFIPTYLVLRKFDDFSHVHLSGTVEFP